MLHIPFHLWRTRLGAVKAYHLCAQNQKNPGARRLVSAAAPIVAGRGSCRANGSGAAAGDRWPRGVVDLFHGARGAAAGCELEPGSGCDGTVDAGPSRCAGAGGRRAPDFLLRRRGILLPRSPRGAPTASSGGQRAQWRPPTESFKSNPGRPAALPSPRQRPRRPARPCSATQEAHWRFQTATAAYRLPRAGRDADGRAGGAQPREEARDPRCS